MRFHSSVLTVPVPDDAAARAALTTRLAALADVRHPHLLALLEARPTGDGTITVVHARGEAADLPAVLAVRGRLAPGEAAAVGVQVAQALAALHAAGLVHGPLDPGDVVLRAGGAPALRARAAMPPEEWTSAEDVRSLARLVEALLGPRRVGGGATLAGDPVADPDGALRVALVPALGADAALRPEAGTLAAGIDAVCECCDVRLPDAATLAGAALAGRRRGAGEVSAVAAAEAGDARGRRAPRRPGTPGVRQSGSAGARGLRPRRGPRPRLLGAAVLRPAAVVVGVGLAVGLMTGAALELRGGDGSPAAPTGAVEAAATANPAPSPAIDRTLDRDHPEAAAAELTQRRLDVLAGASTEVAAIDVVGSPAHDADTALLTQLAAAGTRPVGPHATVQEATGLGHDASRATVRLRYVVDAHEQAAADGTRAPIPASAVLTATLTLRWTADGWRVEGVA